MEAYSLHSYPRAILHIDGDSFFASCEVAKNPSLKGKPVITGKERGIASAMTYEAKARGVTRGMRVSEILKTCPDAVILPSDYETYSLYSKRMFDIVRRYTPDVDEYSIDECFADLTGLRRHLHASYEKIAEIIKSDLDRELGMTFSVGLAPTKVLAKVASKWKKPDGLTFIPLNKAHFFLKNVAVEKIWGIGPQTSAFLKKFGILTAHDLTIRSEAWVKMHLSKPYHEIWRELRGEVVFDLNLEAKNNYQSISKTKTFTPASSDEAFVFSQLSKNIENACIKARRHKLVSAEVYFFLKTQDFKYRGLEVRLSQPVAYPQDIIKSVEQVFRCVYRPGVFYRSTGIVLGKLQTATNIQQDLFGQTASIIKIRKIYEFVDKLSEKFGKHAVFLGSSLQAVTTRPYEGERGMAAKRSGDLFKGETKRKRLGIPMLGEAI